MLPPEEEEPIEEEEPLDPIYVQRVAAMVATGLSLGLLCLAIYGGTKSGSKIFLMADANLLFPAPLRPQSVLFFRLTNQIAMQIMAGAYFLFQLPTLTDALGLGVGQTLMLVAAFILLLLIYQLTTVLVYSLGATHERIKRFFKPIALGIPLLIALYTRIGTQGSPNLFDAAVSLYSAPWIRFLPFVGWLGGMVESTLAGNLPTAFAYLGALVLGCAALLALIYRLKVDFYEDALQSATETAELTQAAQAGGNVTVTRKKSRSEKLRRDGLRHGSGASVLFFKAIYNRFRFAMLGVFSVASLVYATAVTAVCLFSLQAGGSDESGMRAMIAFAILAAMIFYHATTSPANADLSFGGYGLIPASGFSKLFYSIAGGTTCTAIDLLPAMLIALCVLRPSPLLCLLWYLLLCIMDATTTSFLLFLDCTIPVSVSKQVKAVIVVLFLYFGLVPMGIGFAIGALTGQMALFCLIASAVNLGFAAAMTGVSALSLSEGRR